MARTASTFAISEANRLAGGDADLRAAIAEATYNLDHRLEPAFTIAFAEALPLAGSIAANEARSSPGERLALVDALQRRRELLHRAPLYESGFRFIFFFYQRLLFGRETRERALRTALRAFATRVLIPQARIGGTLVAWNQLEARRAVVGFSLGRRGLGAYLASVGFSDPMELAADNRPLRTVAPDLLARYFVPELVYDHVAAGHARPDGGQAEQDLFTIAFWNLGLR